MNGGRCASSGTCSTGRCVAVVHLVVVVSVRSQELREQRVRAWFTESCTARPEVSTEASWTFSTSDEITDSSSCNHWLQLLFHLRLLLPFAPCGTLCLGYFLRRRRVAFHGGGTSYSCPPRSLDFRLRRAPRRLLLPLLPSTAPGEAMCDFGAPFRSAALASQPVSHMPGDGRKRRFHSCLSTALSTTVAS